MNRDLSGQFRNLEWLNSRLETYGLIQDHCRSLEEAYEVLSGEYFNIYHFAKGQFRQFPSAGHLRAYIKGAERENGWNPFPSNLRRMVAFLLY